MTTDERHVMMVNQISRFFAHLGEEKATEAISGHLVKFWDPRMRAAITSYADRSGAGIDPFALEAVKRLARPPGPVAATPTEGFA